MYRPYAEAYKGQNLMSQTCVFLGVPYDGSPIPWVTEFLHRCTSSGIRLDCDLNNPQTGACYCLLKVAIQECAVNIILMMTATILNDSEQGIAQGIKFSASGKLGIIILSLSFGKFFCH
jgi:hypothetical protein